MPPCWKQPFFQVLLLLDGCRHIITKTPGTTPQTSEPIGALPTDVRSVFLRGDTHTEKLEVLSPVNLTLECTWATNRNKPPNITGLWRKDGELIANSHVQVQLENGQYNLRRVFLIVNEDNLGTYSCVFANEAEITFVLAAPQIGDVRDKPVISYVGDYVVIACKMEDAKPKPSTWRWFKENGTDKEHIAIAAEPHRYEIKIDERKTRLLVYNLTEADSGLYYCGAVYNISTTLSHVELKVITFYEPLKPFVVIVVEVVILVAAILLYERSQSKKKEPAGDGMNADQTNTLTQDERNGHEGNSSMRQRKQ